MNLGTQLKWFHDFWTSTQVVKIHQSLVRKLNYQRISKIAKTRKPFSSRGPTVWPTRAARTRALGPRDAAHGAGEPARAGDLAKETPD
jgi:hypothetical protein